MARFTDAMFEDAKRRFEMTISKKLWARDNGAMRLRFDEMVDAHTVKLLADYKADAEAKSVQAQVPSTRHDLALFARTLPVMGYFKEDGRVTDEELALYSRDPLFGRDKGHPYPKSMEMSAVMVYMADSMRAVGYMGFSACRMCGERAGTYDMMTPDYKWRFPEKWQHYITAHGFKPPAEFIHDAMVWTGYDQHEDYVMEGSAAEVQACDSCKARAGEHCCHPGLTDANSFYVSNHAEARTKHPDCPMLKPGTKNIRF